MDDFAELIGRHEAMVFRTLARLTGEREGLDDLAQEVFLRLLRALPHFRGRARVSTYLYRIIVNVVNDEWSRRRRARQMEPIDEGAAVFADPAPGPAERFENDRFQEAVESVLANLRLEDRTILTLFYQEGRRYEEIAEILDQPLGTVKTHLHRARARLKAGMEEWVSQCRTNC